MHSCNSGNIAFIKQTHPIQELQESQKVGLAKVVGEDDKMKEKILKENGYFWQLYSRIVAI